MILNVNHLLLGILTMSRYLQHLSAFFVFALTLLSPQISCASGTFESFNNDIRGVIIKQAVADRIVDGKSLGDIAVVNKQWNKFFKEALQPWQPCWKAYLGITPENEQVYRALFNSTLECRKNPTDKDPAYKLSFDQLTNLSVRSLDLPAGIDASEHLLITDKLQQFFEVAGNKIHILIATKSMISQRMKSMMMSKEPKGSINVLKNIMTKWKDSVAPVGILWRWSGDNNLTRFDFLVTLDLSAISSMSLYDNWKKGTGWFDARLRRDPVSVSKGSFFVLKLA